MFVFLIHDTFLATIYHHLCVFDDANVEESSKSDDPIEAALNEKSMLFAKEYQADITDGHRVLKFIGIYQVKAKGKDTVQLQYRVTVLYKNYSSKKVG